MSRNNNGAAADDLDSYVDDLAGTGDDGAGNNDVDVSSSDTGRDTNVSTDAQTATRDTQTQTQDPAGKATDNKATAAPTGKAAGTDTNAQQQQAEPPRHLGDGIYMDKQGNIVTQDGKLVAEKGFAARMHQQNRRLVAQNEQLNGETTQLRTRVTELSALDNSMRNAGINADEMAQAVDFAARYKRGDVLGIAKEIVALAMASGHNATDILGKDVGDNIDMRGVKAMLDQRLGPIANSRQEDERKAAAEKAARDNYTRFVSDNEYADVHGDALVRLAQAENINLQQAYNRLSRFAFDNQLDFSMPLGPQIEERNNQARQQQQTQQPTQHAQQKPMPNGATTRVNGVIPTTNVEMASPDDDWGTIIRQAMNSTM